MTRESLLAESLANIQEALNYLRTRKAFLAEYRTLASEKADQMRSFDPILSDHVDTGQTMTHTFLRYAWRSYLARAEERFGKDAVARALREIGPF